MWLKSFIILIYVISIFLLGMSIAQKIKRLKIKKAIKGSDRYFTAFFKAFKINYKKKIGLLVLISIALNGCKPKKVRRV